MRNEEAGAEIKLLMIQSFIENNPDWINTFTECSRVEKKNTSIEDRNTHVYLIHLCGTDFYKIGVSKNPYRRLRSLQTSAPAPLELIGYMDAALEKKCYLTESRLHEKYDQHRVSGEWFCLGKDDLGDVLSNFDHHISHREFNYTSSLVGPKSDKNWRLKVRLDFIADAYKDENAEVSINKLMEYTSKCKNRGH